MISGKKRVRIKYGRPDMWYKNLEGLVFDIDLQKYNYALVNNEFNWNSLEMAKKINPDLDLKFFICFDIIYLMDVEFFDEPYYMEEFPYLHIGNKVMLKRTPKNKTYMPKILDGTYVTVWGFEQNGQLVTFTPKFIQNKYKGFSHGLRRNFKIDDIYLDNIK